MVVRSVIQVLREAEEIKVKVQNGSDFLNDSYAWANLQRLQAIYYRVLMLDLEYALDQKVELDLWHVAFKTHISALQEMLRNKKTISKRSELQALLMWSLQSASGFYLSLLHEICDLHEIDLPFRRKESTLGLGHSTIPKNPEKNASRLNASCFYLCQYCLVHLGDIARYNNERQDASEFYRQAIMVIPSNGHPYNQLAILEATKGDKLSTVFFYILGTAVKNPFPASVTNLCNTLNSAIDRKLVSLKTKLTAKEFIRIFLHTHGLLYSANNLPHVDICIKSLNSTMTALVATQTFTQDQLLKMTTVNLYALKHLTNTRNAKKMTADELIVQEYVLELLAGSLSAFLVPVHTLKHDETLLNYYALPAVRILLLWIRGDADVLKTSTFSKRLQIWPSLCNLLNAVQPYLQVFNYGKYETTPLSEDITLQAYCPLLSQLSVYDFKSKAIHDEKVENLIRMKRITDFGWFLSNFDMNNTKLISVSQGENENTASRFEPCRIQPDPTIDLLEQIKSFNISHVAADDTKVSAATKDIASFKVVDVPRLHQFDISSSSPSANRYSKRETGKLKIPKQNIALQSIFKKIEENSSNKQYQSSAANEQQPSPPSLSMLPQPRFSKSHLAGQQYSFDINEQQYFPNKKGMLPTTNEYSNQLSDIPLRQESLTDDLSGDSLQSSWLQSKNITCTAQPEAPWDNGSSTITMRQTMLKDVQSAQHDVSNAVTSLPTTSGYSLFNASSWIPNLMEHATTDTSTKSFECNTDLQHSMFTTQEPQSLVQLLQQQQQQQLQKK